MNNYKHKNKFIAIYIAIVLLTSNGITAQENIPKIYKKSRILLIKDDDTTQTNSTDTSDDSGTNSDCDSGTSSSVDCDKFIEPINPKVVAGIVGGLGATTGAALYIASLDEFPEQAPYPGEEGEIFSDVDLPGASYQDVPLGEVEGAVDQAEGVVDILPSSFSGIAIGDIAEVESLANIAEDIIY